MVYLFTVKDSEKKLLLKSWSRWNRLEMDSFELCRILAYTCIYI